MLDKLEKIFSWFSGKWNLKRDIENVGLAIGVAEFISIENDLIKYEEKVKFHPNNQLGKSFDASQSYFYSFDKNKGIISKIFSLNSKQDSLFYNLQLNEDYTKAKGVHLCGQDFYKANYKFFENKFLLEYEVRGPKKNFNIVNQYDKD